MSMARRFIWRTRLDCGESCPASLYCTRLSAFFGAFPPVHRVHRPLLLPQNWTFKYCRRFTRSVCLNSRHAVHNCPVDSKSDSLARQHCFVKRTTAFFRKLKLFRQVIPASESTNRRSVQNSFPLQFRAYKLTSDSEKQVCRV